MNEQFIANMRLFVETNAKLEAVRAVLVEILGVNRDIHTELVRRKEPGSLFRRNPPHVRRAVGRSGEGLEILLAAVDGLARQASGVCAGDGISRNSRDHAAGGGKPSPRPTQRPRGGWNRRGRPEKLSWGENAPYWRADSGKYWIGRGYVQRPTRSTTNAPGSAWD